MPGSWLHRSIAVLTLASVVAVVVGCGRPGAIDPSPAGESTSDQARSALRGYIEDVTLATASRYAVRDDRGHEMDTVKIIAVPEAGGFVGLYHSYRDDIQSFNIHLATSSDLLTWTWRVDLAEEASMPTIKPASDGGYVVAWESDSKPGYDGAPTQEPDNHLKFAYYRSWRDLLDGVATKTLDAPRHLSSCAEGTPNLYAASSAFLDVGFHFYADCDLDRQARGTTDWTSWSAAERPSLDDALRIHGVAGGIGDRDVIEFKGFELTLIEGQVVKDDWRTWRVFLHNDATGVAEQLNIRTDAGSLAFTNPTIEQVEIGGQQAMLVSLFVPQEGAQGAETGQLIYYRTLAPVDSE